MWRPSYITSFYSNLFTYGNKPSDFTRGKPSPRMGIHLTHPPKIHILFILKKTHRRTTTSQCFVERKLSINVGTVSVPWWHSNCGVRQENMARASSTIALVVTQIYVLCVSIVVGFDLDDQLQQLKTKFVRKSFHFKCNWFICVI